jgi:hypothetical protein
MFEVVTADHLRASNCEQHIANPNAKDCSEYDTALRNAGDDADKAGDPNTARALRLIAAICSMHFRPEDATEPFAPMLVWADGSRSIAGSDLSQDQLDALKQACPIIQNLPIRTRIADIIWTNDKQATNFSRVAIDGYVGMIQRLLDGTGIERFHEANPSGVTTEEYLEQGLRSFVEFAGRSSTTIKMGGIETSIGLGPLLSNHRDVLESVFGPPIVFCIENIFVHDIGPKVRHRHCHGLLLDGFYFGRDNIYCCWLIYALVFLPLRSN